MYPPRARYVFAKSFLNTTQLAGEKTGLNFGERILLMEIAEARLRSNFSSGTNRSSLAAATGFSRSTIGVWVDNMIAVGWLENTPTGLNVVDWDRLFSLYNEAVPAFCADIQAAREISLAYGAAQSFPLMPFESAEIDQLIVQQTLKTFQDVSLTIAEQLQLDPVERILCLTVVAERLGNDYQFGPRRADLAEMSGLSLSQVGRRMRSLEQRGVVIETRHGFDIADWPTIKTITDTLMERAFGRLAHLLDIKRTFQSRDEAEQLAPDGNSDANLAPAGLSLGAVPAISLAAHWLGLNSDFLVLI